MKRKLSLVIALAVVIAIALPVLASCDTSKTVDKIEFVNPVKNCKVGGTIDYDSLQVKITYTKGDPETKTVAALVADGAKLSRADLTKLGSSTYAIEYKSKTATQVVIVTNSDGTLTGVNKFAKPDFYVEYETNSKIRPDGTPETQADFRVTGEVYEVGNVNKFIFRPVATGFDLVNEEETIDPDPSTTVKVYVKESADSEYALLDGATLADYVAIDKNTYKFTELAADKYFKLEISPDGDVYDLSGLAASERVITVEIKVVDGGYNAYDQLGLSVMADLEKYAWSEIWKADYKEIANEHKTVVTARADSVQLPADDHPLCEYVDQIDWVILHGSIELDPDQMPSLYFWSESGETSLGLDTAKSSLAGLPDAKTWQDSIVGTLRDGFNGGQTDGDLGNVNYARVMDVNRYRYEAEGMDIQGNVGIETDIGLNMTKGLFATKKVSVSGNYNSITYEKRNGDIRSERSELNRILVSYADYQADSTNPAEPHVTDPVSHWNVFQFVQPRVNGVAFSTFTLKNLAMTGNSPMINTNVDDQGNEQKKQAFIVAGLCLSNSYATQVNYINFNARAFSTSIVQDNYGDFSATNGTFDSASSKAESAKVLVDNAKLYNNYSNMCFLWRGNMTIRNSEMIGSGGPLLILCDSNRWARQMAQTDIGGPELTVDRATKLEAYAYGQESWYTAYGIEMMFNLLNQSFEPGLNKLGNTIFKEENGNKYVNVIAAIIPDANDIMDGGKQPDADGFTAGADPDGTHFIDVRGKFTVMDGDQVWTKMAMHESFHGMLWEMAKLYSNPDQLGPVLQTGIQGAECLAINNLQTFINGNIPQDDMLADDYVGSGQWAKERWTNNESNLLFIYMNAGPISHKWCPYFGIVLGCDRFVAGD